MSQVPRLQIRHNCCFDLPQFPQFFSQVLIFSIFSFSSTLASPGTSTSIIILANCLLFVYYNRVSSIVFKLMISLYAIKNHKGFDFLGLLNFSRDILLLLSLLILLLLLPLLSLLSLRSASLSIVFWIQLEFRKADFWGEEKTRATGVPREKPLGERERTSNKQIYMCLLIDHLQFPCPEPRSQWIKLSTELLTHLP